MWEHPLPDFSGQILLLLAVRVYPESLGNMPAQMPLLMVKGVLELLRRRSEGYDNHALPPAGIAIRNARVQPS